MFRGLGLRVLGLGALVEQCGSNMQKTLHPNSPSWTALELAGYLAQFRAVSQHATETSLSSGWIA